MLSNDVIGPHLYAATGSEQAYREARRRIDRVDELVRTLDERREELGMSNAELARRTQLSPQLVRRVFSAGGLNPAVGTLTTIAAHVGPRTGSSSARQLSATFYP